MNQKQLKEIDKRITKVDTVISKRLVYIEKLYSKYKSYKDEIDTLKLRYNNYLTKGE